MRSLRPTVQIKYLSAPRQPLLLTPQHAPRRAERLHDRIVAGIQDRVPNVEVVANPVDPVLGALRLAAALV